MSWIHLKSGNKTIEEVSTKEYHLLKLGYGVTGLVQLTVMFLSDNCLKQSSVLFEGNHYFDIKLNNKIKTCSKHNINNIIIILTANVITSIAAKRVISGIKANPENLTIALTERDYGNTSFFLTFLVTTFTSSITLAGNVSLAPEIVVPLGLECNTSFDFTVTILEAVSGAVIDEYSGKYVVYSSNPLCTNCELYISSQNSHLFSSFFPSYIGLFMSSF